ncbi:alpha-2-macroglobulin-like protein 1 [Strix aluco]|uniref:alpha-2-macroglobulin-like protein 1 n=1 Tax=Strix aluco TaxID=111821 RepID=UPI003DA61016
MGSAAVLPCLLLCILHLTAGASAKPHYMVLFPSVFYYPYTGKVHVHLMDLDEPVRVTLHLASSHSVPNITLEEQDSDILQLNWPRFSNVSSPPEEVYEVAHLHVSIQGGSLEVSEQKKVLVKTLELGTLVQTDKDVYKPGETVKFRIVRFDQNFIPSNRQTIGLGSSGTAFSVTMSVEETGEGGNPPNTEGTLPLVTVQDPSGYPVGQWQEVNPQQGIVDLSFSLGAEPALGMYNIKVEGNRHFFSVKEYGLPHFEVLIQLPCVLTVKDEKIPLDVCGRYPSGKTFRGRAEVKLCQSQNYFYPKRSTRICAEFRGQSHPKEGRGAEQRLLGWSLGQDGQERDRQLHGRASYQPRGDKFAGSKGCRTEWREVLAAGRVAAGSPRMTADDTQGPGHRAAANVGDCLLQTGRNGCFSSEVPVSSFTMTTSFDYEIWLSASATMLEDGTGMRRNMTKSCKIKHATDSITFENIDKFYKPGMSCTGTMLLKGADGSALKEEEFLLVVEARGERQNKTLVTDRSGRASFELDTSRWSDVVSMRGDLKDDRPVSEHESEQYFNYRSVLRYLYPFPSDSKSFLKIHRVEKKLPCGQPQQLRVEYLFDEAAMGIELQKLDVVFLGSALWAWSLSPLLSHGPGLRGAFSLELPIGPKLAPTAKVLVYVVLPDSEMVADSTELKVEKCFANKVNLSFSEQRALVGSQLRLKLQAAPGSLCAIYAKDQRMQSSSARGKLNPITVRLEEPQCWAGPGLLGHGDSSFFLLSPILGEAGRDLAPAG